MPRVHCWLYGVRRSRSMTVMLRDRSEEHTSELQSQSNLVCRLLLEKKKIILQYLFEKMQLQTAATPPSPALTPSSPAPALPTPASTAPAARACARQASVMAVLLSYD